MSAGGGGGGGGGGGEESTVSDNGARECLREDKSMSLRFFSNKGAAGLA